MLDPDYWKAYDRGGVKATGLDYGWYWRVHIGLWAAETSINLNGYFIECGVNKGFLSSAIMEHLNWDKHSKTFYLLDTFKGLDPDFVSDREKQSGILDKNKKAIDDNFYTTSFEGIRKNFSQWKNLQIIPGTIPKTLSKVNTSQVAFLHIDMNCAPPEVAALDYFWPKLVKGAAVLLDDYAFFDYQPQKEAMDNWAKKKGYPSPAFQQGKA